MNSMNSVSHVDDKVVDRIKKLLALSRSTNEHEAAQAAARAAQLMSDHAITSALFEVASADDAAQAETRAREGIVEQHLPDAPERRVAWRDRVACAVCASLDGECLYEGGRLHMIGRASAVQAWVYTCAYLFTEIERLADAAWQEDGADLAAVGQRPRAWKGAFRLGAADVVAARLRAQRAERLATEAHRARALAAPGLGTPRRDRSPSRASTGPSRSSPGTALRSRPRTRSAPGAGRPSARSAGRPGA